MLSLHLRRCASVIVFLSGTLLFVPAHAAQGVPAQYRRANEIALERIDALLDLAKQPGRLSVAGIEALFQTRLEQHPCGEHGAACQWFGELAEQEVSVTNVFLPNPSSTHYRSGADVMLEIPSNSCVPVDELEQRLHTKATPPDAPPAILAFTGPDEPFEPDSLSIFRDIPGMDPAVVIDWWSQRGCLVRFHLNALLTRERPDRPGGADEP
jgi:hypothetical protein